MTALEAGSDLAEREKLRFESPVPVLDRRLARLPGGHPSAVGYPDVRRTADGGSDPGEPERVRPLTDAEHAEHIAEVEEKLDEAREGGLATDIQHTIDPHRVLWSEERDSLHDAIVSALYGEARDVPCEGKAILAGGLPGAGKTTVIAGHAGIDLSQFLRINPDSIKEELARRGMVPAIDGLSPMEASDLVHEESSHIAKRLAQLAQSDGRNVIWDVTMSSAASTVKRVDLLRAAGYSQVSGIFVDIPVELSVARAETRHREGHEGYRVGGGQGGRYVSADTIRSLADPDWGSVNRRSFEQLKHRFDAWSVYDNSYDGTAPTLVDSTKPEHPDQKERTCES